MKTLRFICAALIATCLLSCSNDLSETLDEENLIEIQSRAMLPSFVPAEYQDNVVLTQELHRLYRVVKDMETLEDVTAAGWTEDLTGYLPNMGNHYANMKFLSDGKFKIHKPETILVGCTADGNYKAVGVEYIVPGDPGVAPEGFSGEWDAWYYIDGVGWTLHVWLLYENPDGLFYATNSNVALENNCTGSED
ncbi:hypothetical protein [Robertkochia flava]|uniref:hypothetical protein n=1 Tax=Robertkochia flava TaxID=3447986 RepID=UPI001CCB013B|nr:hypothetical protein [Robertkochia marina]